MNISLSKLPWHTQIAVFCAISLAGFAAFYFLYASPAREEASARLKQIEALKTEIAKGNATAQKLPEFRTQVADLEARLQELRVVLPEEKDIGDLIRRMQTLAVQSNLHILSFKPLPTVTKDLYMEVPHQVEFEGAYHHLGSFLDSLGRLPLIIQVADIDIKGNDKAGSATMTAKCVATTFVLVEPKTKAPAKAAGARR
jgi:type IV pilus assembly protein PilO